jgi:hypothetical protein
MTFFAFPKGVILKRENNIMNNKIFVFSRRYPFQWVSFAILEPFNAMSLENHIKMGRLVQYI